jgi:hypothetical protein
MGLLVILTSFIFYHLLIKVSLRQKPIRATYLIFLILAIIISFRIGIDKSLFATSETELFAINQTRSFYPSILGRMFENKAALTLFKLERNFFWGLDPNIYFFAGHPRERAGIGEFEKFSWIIFPFFLLGLFKIFQKGVLIKLIFFLSIIIISNTLTSPNSQFDLALSFSLISSLSAFSLNK